MVRCKFRSMPQLVYQVPVKKDIGNVIGLRYGFEGTGAIYSVKLQRETEKPFLRKNFRVQRLACPVEEQ